MLEAHAVFGDSFLVAVNEIDFMDYNTVLNWEDLQRIFFIIFLLKIIVFGFPSFALNN